MTDAPSEFRYKRVLLKVSGEVLMGDQAYGIDMKTVEVVAQAVADVARQGIEICLVIGGGNIFRGLSECGRSPGRGVPGCARAPRACRSAWPSRR